MRIRRDQLTVLFNRLHDRGEDRFTISHPSEEIGDLVSVKLEKYDESEVTFELRNERYAEAVKEVERQYGEPVANDLPSVSEYTQAVMASGMIPIANEEEIRRLLDRYGDPDLMAGHPPVFAGFDTNLLPWRIDRILGLRDPEEGLGYVNGFVLATGVRDELEWDDKCHEADPFVDAFGEQFDEYWNQPLGPARIWRLGQLAYRNIRDIQQATEIDSGRGDEAIIEAYDGYDDEHRAQILLFSNDRNFVEMAQGHTLLGQHVELPTNLPRSVAASWEELELLLYHLTMIFGIVEVPTTTVQAVWPGKEGEDWQRERLKLDCRSPKVEPKLENDLAILEAYSEVQSSS
jgi:hypothetical protein